MQQQEALEECKALARTWLSQADASLPDTIATGTTGGRIMHLPSCRTGFGFATLHRQQHVGDLILLQHAVGELTAKLERIMKSDYFTIQPQIQQMQQVWRF